MNPLDLDVPDFRFDGLCTQITPDVFFPEKGDSVEPAKAVCRDCPVRAACLDYALARDEPHGVWGGMSVNERQRLRQERGLPSGWQSGLDQRRDTARQLAGQGHTTPEIARVLGTHPNTVKAYLADLPDTA